MPCLAILLALRAQGLIRQLHYGFWLLPSLLALGTARHRLCLLKRVLLEKGIRRGVQCFEVVGIGAFMHYIDFLIG